MNNFLRVSPAALNCKPVAYSFPTTFKTGLQAVARLFVFYLLLPPASKLPGYAVATFRE